MSFDWKSFAGGFLEEITEGIEKRETEAKDYKEEQKKKAERNLEIVRTRNQRAQQAAQIGRQAMQLGASKEQVIAAMSTGAGGIQDFYTKLQQIAASNNLQAGQQLTEDDISTGIAMTGIPSIDSQYINMTLDKVAQQTYGGGRAKSPTPSTLVESDTPQMDSMRELFALDERSKVDRDLEKSGFYGDMSIADINFLSQQSEYKALVPNATMTFADIPNFNSDAKFEFGQDLISAQVDGLKARESEIDAAESLALNGEYVVDGVALSGPEAKAHATMAIRLEQSDFLIRKAAEDYTPTGFFDDQSVKTMIIRTMNQKGGGPNDKTGLEYYNELRSEYLAEEEESIDPSEITEEPKAKEPKEKTPLTATEEATLLTKKRITENVYYRDDEGNVVKGVPPRPTLGLGSIFGGAGLGGEDIEEIYKGNAPVPERLRPNQWDELFGATHNPDGSPKQLKGE